MFNRLKDLTKDKQQEEMQKIINKIIGYATELHDLMDPGMTLDIQIPVKKDIIVPNQPPEVKRLYIMRPKGIFYIAGK